AERFPLKTVCAWMGNSEVVAMKHYLHVKEEHFDQATGRAAQGAAVSVGKHRTKRYRQIEKPSFSEGFEGTEYPQGESNPCPLAENQVSWATRRWGRCRLG